MVFFIAVFNRLLLQAVMASLCGHVFNDPGQVCTHESGDSLPQCKACAPWRLGPRNVGSLLYERFPGVGPGLLSKMKSINVDNERLARVCIDRGLDAVLYHSIPNYNVLVTRFKLEAKQFPRHSNGRIFTPKFLADIVEALIGVAWLDLKKDMAARGILIDQLLSPLITDIHNFGHRPIHVLNTCKWKTALKIKNEMTTNGLHRCTIEYGQTTIASKTYFGSKEAAQNRAAVVAIEYFRRLLGFEI